MCQYAETRPSSLIIDSRAEAKWSKRGARGRMTKGPGPVDLEIAWAAGMDTL